MKIGFIGGGNMAEAILAAVLSRNLARANEITVSDIDANKRANLQQKYRVDVTGDNLKAVTGKEIIVLAIKPQVLAEVSAGLKGKIRPDQMVISILAGKSIQTISSRTGPSLHRPFHAQYPRSNREGITVWTATPQVTAAQKKTAAAILGVMGTEIYADDEKYLDMATAVSGSGPALCVPVYRVYGRRGGQARFFPGNGPKSGHADPLGSGTSAAKVRKDSAGAAPHGYLSGRDYRRSYCRI